MNQQAFRAVNLPGLSSAARVAPVQARSRAAAIVADIQPTQASNSASTVFEQFQNRLHLAPTTGRRLGRVFAGYLGAPRNTTGAARGCSSKRKEKLSHGLANGV